MSKRNAKAAKAARTAAAPIVPATVKPLLAFTVPVSIKLTDIYVSFNGKEFSKNANVYVVEALPLPGGTTTDLRGNISIPRALLSPEAWQGAMERGKARWEAKQSAAALPAPTNGKREYLA